MLVNFCKNELHKFQCNNYMKHNQFYLKAKLIKINLIHLKSSSKRELKQLNVFGYGVNKIDLELIL